MVAVLFRIQYPGYFATCAALECNGAYEEIASVLVLLERITQEAPLLARAATRQPPNRPRSLVRVDRQLSGCRMKATDACGWCGLKQPDDAFGVVPRFTL